MRLTLILAVCFFIAFGLQAQEVTYKKIDRIFESIEKNDEGMGCISLFENGKEVYHNPFGSANIQHRIKASTETKYRIGSLTKTFTATVIMQLVEEKKLTLNSKLSQFFPNIPHADNITITQMLRHSSGLKDKKYLLWKYRGKKFNLNQKVAYANSNYVLLAEIAEKIENKSFSAILTERIFTPCDLGNTFFGYNKNSIISTEASSYRKIAGDWQLVTPSDLSEPHGAGGIISTPSDVNLFYHHLFSKNLVSESTLAEMKKTVDGVGIGLMKFPYENKKVWGHSGNIDGFQSTVVFFPDANFSLCLISNGVDMPMNDILVAVLRVYFE